MFWAFLFLLLVALLIAVVPVWPYSRRWGYAPTAVAGAVLIAFMLLVYLGYIAIWSSVGPPYNADDEPQQFEQELLPESHRPLAGGGLQV